MPGATCHPGQGGTYGFASCPVLLTPKSGQFPSTQGTVSLSSNKGGSDSMTVVAWTSGQIVALIPIANPGTGEDGERFSVSIDEGAFTAGNVQVAGPAGNYPIPPTHTPNAARETADSQS